MTLKNSGFDVALVEPGRAGAFNAKSRGLDTVICATMEEAKFKSNSIHSIWLFDVLEHIEDEIQFLKHLKWIIKNQGFLYMTVPAYSFLWSGEDVSAGHFRRYTRSSICEIIDRAGFDVVFSSYIFRFLPLPISIFRVIPYRMGSSPRQGKSDVVSRDHVFGNGSFNKFLNFVLHLELERIKQNKPMKFGGSCLVVAKSS